DSGLAKEALTQLSFQLRCDRGKLLQVGSGVLLALADTLTTVAVPGTGLLDQSFSDTQLKQLALARYALAVEDLELGLLERRGQLVLDHLHAGFVADNRVAFLDPADAAYVQPYRGIELERVAAGGGFRAAEHHADLHADLVDEDHQRVGALDVGRELAQCLRHQARMASYLAIAHFAFDFGFGRESRHRVDHDDVHRTRAHQQIDYFQGLLPCVRLRQQQ